MITIHEEEQDHDDDDHDDDFENDDIDDFGDDDDDTRAEQTYEDRRRLGVMPGDLLIRKGKRRMSTITMRMIGNVVRIFVILMVCLFL